MKTKTCNSCKVVAILAITFVLAFVSINPAGAVWYPNNITALGDSITIAYNTGRAFTGAPANSWSTGSNGTVNSLYLRILAVNPLISGKTTNLAVSGAKMADLNGQASGVSRKAEYVTILIGANDVCTSSVSSMTSVATFQAQFEKAMATLTKRASKARIYVVSIPNVYNLWDVLKDNSSARSTWALFGICQSLLANPLSTAQADIDRRAAVLQRNIEFNAVLAAVCARYSQCRFDENKVFNTSFMAADVSTRDYFHPSLAGQAKLAAVAWSASIFVIP